MPVIWFRLLINLPGLQTLQEQDDPHVPITLLLMLSNFVLKLYPYPLDAVITIVVIYREAKVPTTGPKIVCKRSYKRFSCDSYVDDVKNICWSDVIKTC